jgi:hypothetical protein
MLKGNMGSGVDIYEFLAVAAWQSGWDQRENHQKPEISSVVGFFIIDTSFYTPYTVKNEEYNQRIQGVEY